MPTTAPGLNISKVTASHISKFFHKTTSLECSENIWAILLAALNSPDYIKWKRFEAAELAWFSKCIIDLIHFSEGIKNKQHALAENKIEVHEQLGELLERLLPHTECQQNIDRLMLCALSSLIGKGWESSETNHFHSLCKSILDLIESLNILYQNLKHETPHCT